jgi:hypothetical protein
MSRIRPPLTTSMTVPVTMPSSSLMVSIVPLLGQDQPTLLVLLLQDQGLDVVADGDDVVGVDVVLDRELTRGDDALGLVPDVEENLVAVDPDDDARDDVAVIELFDGAVDGGEEVLEGPDVVDGDLGGTLGRGGGVVGDCSGHVGGTPRVDR